MKTFRIYTPWDSLTVEASTEREAKVKALRQLLSEIEFASPTDLDAEELPEDYQGI